MISSLSVVIPAYNEEVDLVQTTLSTEAALRSCVSRQLEWLLVDDGSTDSTYSEITRLVSMIPNVVPLRHPENRGLGAAIWTGMTHASMEWCTWTPADGQVDPQSLINMMQLEDESDLVLLMRDEKGRGHWRQLLTLALYGWMRIMFGFDPYGFSGIYLIRKRILQDISSSGTTAVQNYAVAIHCQKLGYRIRQTQAVMRPRMSGKSKVANFPTMLKTLYELFRLRATV
jgi:dolichol-phosphate mannosyltransferase